MDQDEDDDDASIDRFSLNGLLAAPEIPSNFGIYFFFSVIVVGRCLKKRSQQPLIYCWFFVEPPTCRKETPRENVHPMDALIIAA